MKITVVIAEPGKRARRAEIENDLPGFRAVVGGHLEALSYGDGILMYFDEEGRLKNLPVNRIINGYELFGGIVFFRVGQEGEEISLRDDDVAKLLSVLNREFAAGRN